MTNGERYRELARRLFTEADDTAINEFFASTYEGEHGGEHVDLQRFRESVAAFRSAFGPVTYEVHHTTEDGDLLYAYWTARGCHSGPAFGLEPTERPIRVTGLTLNRFKDGKIVWGLVKWDRLALLEGLR